MGSLSFRQMLDKKWDEGKYVCPGLDSVDANRMCKVVDETHDLACVYKINFAFYIAKLEAGITALRCVINHIHGVAQDVPIILDCKDADIDNTNNGYVEMIESLNVNAITTNPYLGQEALLPFLSRKDMGVFVLCKTSNKGAGEFQDVEIILSVEEEKQWRIGIGDNLEATTLKLYEYVAYRVSREWNKNDNCGLVVGATYPQELEEVRKIVGDNMPLLIPGIGAQGGDEEATVKAAKRCFIINSSRKIISAKDPRSETQKLHDLISQFRK